MFGCEACIRCRIALILVSSARVKSRSKTQDSKPRPPLRSVEIRRSELESGFRIGDLSPMSKVKEIESALAKLSVQDLQNVRDWLDDFIEDQLEVSDEFKAKIQRSQNEIADGVYSRVRKPEAGQ